MCERCEQAWRDLYPQLKKWEGWEDLTEDDNRASEILYTYTGFPIVSPEAVREQLQYLCDHGPAATSQHIIDSIDRRMDEALMDELKKHLPFRNWVKRPTGGWDRTSYIPNIRTPYAYRLVDGKTQWVFD